MSVTPKSRTWPDRWRPGERARALSWEHTQGRPESTAWVQHRDHPALVFKLVIRPDETVAAFEVRPLVVTAPGVLDTESLDAAKPLDISSRELRRFRVGEMRDVAVERIRSAAVALPPNPDASWLQLLQVDPRPGRRGRSDLLYAELAQEYDEALAQGSGAAARMAKRRNLSTQRLRGLLGEARSRGLLTEAPAGRQGGTLTPKALELLKREAH